MTLKRHEAIRPGETPAERKERRRGEWNAELSRLHARQRQGKDLSPAQARQQLETRAKIATIEKKLRSQEFKVWYETTTGEPVEQWLEEHLLDSRDWCERVVSTFKPPFFTLTRLEWLQEAIERVAAFHRWTDPEQKIMWAAEIQACENPHQRRFMFIRLATPAWVRRRQISEIYKERDRVAAETGVKHHVDHIVPVVHPRVCGLNVPWNMRVIPATENHAKSNKFAVGH